MAAGDAVRRGPGGSDALEPYLRDFALRAPSGRQIADFLREAGCQLIYAAAIPPAGPRRPWKLHLRLPRQMEAEFGFSRELLLLATNWPEFQVRSLEFVKEEVANAPRVEPEVACLVVDDLEAAEKAFEWCGNEFTVVALTPRQLAAEDAAQELRRSLRETFYGRNFYAEAGPVTGERFFGRANILRKFDSELINHRPIGVFGLRKIGKTSLIKQFLNSLQLPFVGIYLDLQGERIHRDARHLLVSLLNRLRQHDGVIEKEQLVLGADWRTDPANAASEAADRLAEFLTSRRDMRLLVALDEIEALYPTSESEGLDGWDDVLAVLRSLVQSNSNIDVIFAGVNSSVFELPSFQGRDNPVFSLAQPTYLGCMSDREMERMVVHLGKRTGVTWAPEDLALLYRATGGHPYLTRLVCQFIVAGLEPPVQISRAHVSSRLSDYLSTEVATFVEIVDSISRHFPDELRLLREVAGSADGVDVSAIPALTLSHLLGYDLVERVDGRIRVRIGLLGEWLRAT